MKLVLELVVLVMLVKLKLMMLVLELVMLVILVKLDLFGFELLLMVLVELVLIPPKRFYFFTFHPNHSHFLATGHQVTLKRILSSLPTRKQATISAATTRVNIIIATIANRHQSPFQALSNYAVDEIYIRETPSWMFVEDKVGNQEMCFSSILFVF